MKKNYRSGFAAALVIFIVVVLALVGVIAWVHYYYLPHMVIENATSSATTSVATTTAIQSPATTTTKTTNNTMTVTIGAPKAVSTTPPVADPNAPVTITVPLGAQRTTSQGVPITFQSPLSFTNSDGSTSQGADVIVIDNGTSSELLMQVGQMDNLTMHKITLEKVNSAGATFLVQDNYIINP